MKYDFIEIGTSDFDTLLESTRGKGISIEPIKYYLDNLPDSDDVIKVNCAISDSNFETDVFWISPDDIKKYDLPDWLRGCNSIINPHPTALRELSERNLSQIYQTSRCKCITWSTLIDIYNVTSVYLLKIDTEGHDCKIIQNILQSNTVLPDEILFEYNVLTDENEFQSTMNLLTNYGYYKTESGFDTIKVKRE